MGGSGGMGGAAVVDAAANLGLRRDDAAATGRFGARTGRGMVAGLGVVLANHLGLNR